VQVENRLPRAGTDVDHHLVVVEARDPSSLRDELEHALRLFRRELADRSERVDVTLGQDEQVRVGLRVDVAERREPVRAVDVLALASELAEEAVVRQRGSPPP
jgi:hypothetical protein